MGSIATQQTRNHMFIGIDIGGTNIKAVLTNREGEVFGFKKALTPGTTKEIDDALIAIIDELTEEHAINRRNLNAIGIGAAGAIDVKKGIIITSPNIQTWKNYPLARNFEKRTGIRVFMENDATVATMGEWWQGNGRMFRNWIMLTLGTGIGGGAVIDNKLHTGQSGSSMEFGHTTIDYRGKKCKCGSVGCLEQYASASALARTAGTMLKKYPASSLRARMAGEKLTSRMVYEEAIKGDECAATAVREIAFYLGIGIANFVNIFNPEAVILGGGLSRAHRLLFPVIKEVVEERALPGLKDNVKFLAMKNQDRTAALGAAKVAIDSLGV